MCHVISTNAYGVKLRLIVDKLLVILVEMYIIKASVLVVPCRKLFSLARDEVSHGNDVNIVHVEIALNVCLCDPTCTDNAYLESPAG